MSFRRSARTIFEFKNFSQRMLTLRISRLIWLISHNTERVAKSMRTSGRRSVLDRMRCRPPASRRDTGVAVTTEAPGHAQYYRGLFLRSQPSHGLAASEGCVMTTKSPVWFPCCGRLVPWVCSDRGRRWHAHRRPADHHVTMRAPFRGVPSVHPWSCSGAFLVPGAHLRRCPKIPPTPGHRPRPRAARATSARTYAKTPASASPLMTGPSGTKGLAPQPGPSGRLMGDTSLGSCDHSRLIRVLNWANVWPAASPASLGLP